MKFFLKQHKSVLITTGILFLFVLLIRIPYSLHHIVFAQDQARDAFIMLLSQHDGKIFMDYGPKTSVGDFHVPPFYYQLHYIFSLLSSQNPLIMQWVTTAVESLTPVLLFLWMRLLFKNSTAILIAVVYSLFSQVIFSGISAWNPNMIPFLSTLAGLSFFYAYLKKKSWPYIIGILSVVLTIHLHFQGILLLPFVGIMFFLSLKQNIRNIFYWIIGILLALISFIPYFSSELHSHWNNTKKILEFAQIAHSSYFDRISKLDFISNYLPSFFERVMFIQQTPSYIIGKILFIVGLLTLIYSSLKQRRLLLLSIYFVCIFIMLRVYKGDKVDYYMSTLYIFPAIILGLFYEKIKSLSVVLIIIILFISGTMVAREKPFNNIAPLQSAVQFIDSHTQGTIRLIPDNKNVINMFAYGIYSWTDKKIDKKSNTIVEICNANSYCFSNKSLVCAYSRAYTYVQLLQSKTSSVEVGRKTIDQSYDVVIIKLAKSPDKVDYNLLDQDMRGGNDLLVPELFYEY